MSRIFIAVFLVVLTGAATLCVAEEPFAFVLRARSNPYWRMVKEGIQDAAKQHTITAQIYEGESEVSADEQLNVCAAALEKRPAFFAIAAVNPAVGIKCLQRAAALGIPAGDIDGSIQLSEVREKGVPMAFSVGSDNREIGQIAAHYLKKIASTKPLTVLVLAGATGAIAGTQRVEGFTSELKTFGSLMKLEAVLAADWDRMKALAITLDTLQRTPDVNAVFAANDMMALGAVEALRITKKLGAVYVLGVDGTSAAREAVMRGEMTATVAQLPYLVGIRSVEKGIDTRKSLVSQHFEKTDILVLDKHSLESKSDPNFKYLR